MTHLYAIVKTIISVKRRLNSFKKAIVFLVPIYFIIFQCRIIFGENIPVVAKWWNNYEAAISLRFDDSFESHVLFVIPLLNRYDINATFMINPGRERYMRYKDIWEKEVLKAGHHLGNHTFHHTGAKNVREAEHEISDVSKLILALRPRQTNLLVFASGGGELWGGEPWENASLEYKNIVNKNNMIDLYDGQHPAKSFFSSDSIAELCRLVDTAILEKKHQALNFHDIGTMSIKDYVKYLLWGKYQTCDEEKFRQFVAYLATRKNSVWITPVAQIYKYDTERNNIKLQTIEKSNKSLKISVDISTNPDLYDQELTVLLPVKDMRAVSNIFQDSRKINFYSINDTYLSFNIKPFKSMIYIAYF
jgi:hypothetical protein